MEIKVNWRCNVLHEWDEEISAADAGALYHKPWAFKDSDPKKRIATIELFGTLILALFLAKRQKGQASRVRIPVGSDNQGNVYSMLNMASKKAHTSAILMELILQMHLLGCTISASHVPREFNTWADDLTHPHFDGFDPERQLPVPPLLSDFILLPRLLSGTIDFTPRTLHGPVTGSQGSDLSPSGAPSAGASSPEPGRGLAGAAEKRPGTPEEVWPCEIDARGWKDR